MNRTKLYLVAAGVGLVFMFATRPMFGVQHEKANPQELGKLLTDAKLTLANAIETAEKESKGTAVKAYADKEGGMVRVDVTCVAGDAVKWVQIDRAGKVISVKDAPEKGEWKADPKELNKLLTDAKLTLAKAIATAEKESKGTAVKAYADKEGDMVRVDVTCVTADAVKRVQIDRAGKVIFVKDAP